MEILRFPSEEHRTSLLRKSYSERSTDELWFHHAYDYGWRRVQLSDKYDESSIDPDRRWFDPELVAHAETFWRKKLNRPIPNLVSKEPPSEADIEHVEHICRQVRRNIKNWAERNRQAFRVTP